MPVTWIRPAAKRWASAALAVPCGTCGATIGRPCTASYACGEPITDHPSRADFAREFGFVLVADAPLLEVQP
jgi:hypothetical protein